MGAPPGVVVVAVTEVAGAAWRAASTRTALVTVTPTSPSVVVAGGRDDAAGLLNLTGTLVQEWETLVVTARTGYRPQLAVAVAATVGGAALATVAAVLGRGVWLARTRRRTPASAAGALVEDDALAVLPFALRSSSGSSRA